MWSPLQLVTTLICLIKLVDGFSFNTSTPTQCGQMTVQWDGGQEPFHLVVVPTAGRIRNITIPNGSNGRYSFELNEPASLTFIATMYDATGWGSGGTTPVLTVGSSGNSGCLDPNLQYDFTFSIDPQSSPGQCTNMRLQWTDNVTYPVSLFGLIPSGTAWTIPIPQTRGQNTVDWQANIRQGTDFLLLMSNAGQYQTGGSTNLFTVGGGDGGCITDSSPRSYADGSRPPSPSASSNVNGVGGGSSGGTPSGGNGGGESGGGSKTGAIVGGAVGGVAFLVLLALLLVFCLRRRAKERDSSDGSGVKHYGVGSEKKHRRPVDLMSRRTEEGVSREDSIGNRTVDVRGEAYRPSPFRYPSPPEVPTVASLAANDTLGNRVAPSSFPAGFGGSGKTGTSSSLQASTAAPLSTTRSSTDSQRTSEITGTSAIAASSNGPQRASSTAKHKFTPSGSSTQIPPSQANPSVAEEELRGEGVPEQAGPDATFVEHSDAGPVICELGIRIRLRPSGNGSGNYNS